MSVSIPARAAGAFRPSASSGLLAAAGAIAATFTATAFAIPEAAAHYGVSTGTAAIASAVQVGGFTLANMVGSRAFRPSSHLARRSVIGLAGANLASAFAPTFSLLLLTRLAGGFAMGLLTWIAWSDTAEDTKARGEIAAVGPLAGIVTTLMVAYAADLGGHVGLYLFLAAVALVPLAFRFEVSASLPRTRNPIAAAGVWPILIGLGAFTAGGSSVFIFAKVLATENTTMSPFQISAALSLNAAAAIPGARYAGRRRMPGLWIWVTGLCAFSIVRIDEVWLFFVVLILWAVGFWAAVPEAFFILADRSVHPADRVGDAQAAMAIGRIVGPVFGASLASAGSFVLLGTISSGVILAAGALIQVSTMGHRLTRSVPGTKRVS